MSASGAPGCGGAVLLEPGQAVTRCPAHLKAAPQDCTSRLGVPVTKRTFQPNNRRRHKTHGFRLRMRTRAGRAIVGSRRRKGRARLAA